MGDFWLKFSKFENLPKLSSFRSLGFEKVTAKGTLLCESTSILYKPFCVQIGGEVWPPALFRKNKDPP